MPQPVKNGGKDARIYLAAFGKHPGWDDHIEDLGLETDALVEARHNIYIEGIGGNIDSGAWEKLEETQRMGGFAHLLFWRIAGGMLVGRMWSSTDGKGRTRYPMAVLAQCVDLPFAWIAGTVLPALEALEQHCKATASAEDVRAALDRTRNELRTSAEAVGREGAWPVSSAEVASLCESPNLGPDHVGMHRLLYQLDLNASIASSGPARFRQEQRAFNLRLPRFRDSAADGAAAWLNFLISQTDLSMSIAVVLPLRGDWIDAILGEPSRLNWFCLLASPKALPLTSDIPYTLEADFSARADAFIRTVAEGGAPRFAQAQAAPPPRPPGNASLASWKRAIFDWAGKLRDFVKTSRKALWIALAIAIGGLLLVAVGVTILAPLVSPANSPTPQSTNGLQTDLEAWAALCQQYQDWFGRLHSGLRSPDPLDAWEKDAHLAPTAERLRKVLTGEFPVDPRRIANTSGSFLAHIADNPPESARTPQAVRQTRQALALIKDVERGVRDLSADLALMAGTYARRGWARPAAYVQSVAESIAAPTPPSLPTIEAALELWAAAAAAENRWSTVEAGLAKLTPSDNPLVPALIKLVGEAVASEGPDGGREDLKALLDRLEEALKLVRFLQDNWTGTDLDKLNREFDLASVDRMKPQAAYEALYRLVAQCRRQAGDPGETPP